MKLSIRIWIEEEELRMLIDDVYKSQYGIRIKVWHSNLNSALPKTWKYLMVDLWPANKVINVAGSPCCTVLAIGNKIKPLLWSKLALFKTPWQAFKVLPQLSPLGSYLPQLRVFQWDTAWPFSSRDIKITTIQNSKLYFY